MKTTATPEPLAQLLTLLDEAYFRRSWHGTNLRGSVRGLSPEMAAARVGRAQRCIAEIVLHCAYWKYAVRRRLRGEKRGSFALKGSNWFPAPDPLSPDAWASGLHLLEAEHAVLRAAVAAANPATLDRAAAGRSVSPGMLIRGVALHDIYHAGQIQFMKAALRG